GGGRGSLRGGACLENCAAVVEDIVRARPASAKGRYLLSVTLATTMGPGIRVNPSRIRESEILAGGEHGARSGRRTRESETLAGAENGAGSAGETAPAEAPA